MNFFLDIIKTMIRLCYFENLIHDIYKLENKN